MDRLGRFMALVGGLVLVFVILLTCLSILGRLLHDIGHSEFVDFLPLFIAEIFRFFGPIEGDYELVEAGVAFSIFSFLPWCQLSRSHARVDILTSLLSSSLDRFLRFFWELIFSVALFLIAYRLWFGVLDKHRYGETTFLLELPIWIPYFFCGVSASLASFVCFCSALFHLLEFIGFRLGSGSTTGGYVS